MSFFGVAGAPRDPGGPAMSTGTHAGNAAGNGAGLILFPPSVTHLALGTPKGQGRAGNVAGTADALLASRRLLLRPHLGGIIVDHRAGYRARREFVGAGLGNRGDLGAGARNETFLEAS